MNVINNINQEVPVNKNALSQKPAFKGTGLTGLLSASGNTMQFIENQGFLASFLIQDFGGMTAPRTAAGFLRDRDKTGKFNVQEGWEVLGREGLTGPCMMAVAPIALFCAAKFGKSTSVNSKLIKRFGNSFKEIVSKPEFDKTVVLNPNKFKQEFYKTNIEQMLVDTLGKENVNNKQIEYVLEQVNHLECLPKDVKLARFRGKTKYKKQCMNNIIEYIDNIKYNTGSDLEMLQKVRFGSEKFDSKKVFSTKNAIDAMIKYSDDIITATKHLDKLDAAAADSIRDKSLAKRLVTTISTITATLGVLSVLPKIYARSDIAPGARKLENVTDEEKNNISFKGKTPRKGLLERIGAKINKVKSDFVSDELEYNGHNFTNTLMAGLSIFGLLLPRGMRAYNRAQTDENGKKDLTELWEIIIRDITSSLAVVFAVPMLTRACVTSYENKSGFVLMQKDRTQKSKIKAALDLINPYSKAHVLTNSEINSLYNNIDTHKKMLNFCEYIDKNGGDLQKILAKSKNADKIFNSSTVELSSLKGLSKQEKNKKIRTAIEKFDTAKADNMVKDLMKNIQKGKSSKITTFARGLNSVPALVTTFFISPYILGWVIPRFTYKNTRRIHEKQDRENSLKNSEKLRTSV